MAQATDVLGRLPVETLAPGDAVRVTGQLAALERLVAGALARALHAPSPAPTRRRPSALEAMGEALLSVVLRHEVDITTVASTGRRISSVLQTALLARGCRGGNRACPGARHLELDHLLALCLGGDTRLANLEPKCRFCHRDKTDGDMAELTRRRRAGPGP